MNARTINRIETNVERGAAALFAMAVAYAAYRAFSGAPTQRLAAAVSAVLAYALCMLGMKSAARRSATFPVRIFDVRELHDLDSSELLLTEQLHDELVLTDSHRLGLELLLTDADRLEEQNDVGEGSLVLDDVLAAVASDSRVVRLFDRKAMPTPGQLSSSIDRHLERQGNSAHPDASQALSDALAELRRSLR